MIPPKHVQVSLIQPYVHAKNEDNFAHMESYIESAAQHNPDMICLPERWFYLDFTKTPQEYIQSPKGHQYQYVKQWSKEYNTSVISGGIWEYHKGIEQPFVSSYYFRNGQELFHQDKIHLYGAEKLLLSPGKDLVIFTDSALNLSFSILICFDLHISSHLTRLAVDNGAEIIFSPTLIRQTGGDNWKIYLQARALENRIPVISCNSIFQQYGRNFIGQSKIIQFQKGSSSPVSLICDEANSEPGVFSRSVDLSFPNKIRHKRLSEILSKDTITPINMDL
ncbi:MAG: carbon-nitrogen hydrolase family protein [Promethearchaeota archaeon]